MEEIFSVLNLCSVDSGEWVIFSLRNVEICRGADEVDGTLQNSMRMTKLRHPPGRMEFDLALSFPLAGQWEPRWYTASFLPEEAPHTGKSST